MLLAAPFGKVVEEATRHTILRMEALLIFDIDFFFVGFKKQRYGSQNPTVARRSLSVRGSLWFGFGFPNSQSTRTTTTVISESMRCSDDNIFLRLE